MHAHMRTNPAGITGDIHPKVSVGTCNPVTGGGTHICGLKQGMTVLACTMLV